MDVAIAAGTQTTLPTALAESTVPPVKGSRIALTFLANIGLWLNIARNLPLAGRRSPPG